MRKQALKLVTAPAAEPVTLNEVKAYLRIDGSDEDTMLTTFISVARQSIEDYLNRKMITQTWDLWLDNFGSELMFDSLIPDGVTDGKLSEYLKVDRAIDIPIYPLQSVTYLKTYDDAGTDTTMSSGDYIVDVYTEPGRLALKNDTSWPSTYLRPVNGIQIRFVCGYGASGSAVPYPLKHAILEMCGKFYSARGCEDTTLNTVIMSILSPYRLARI
jgi:hypothetical protein